MSSLTLPIPDGVVQALEELVRHAVSDELECRHVGEREGFLDVEGASKFLSLTPGAIRSLVKRGAIPFHKPNGRLLFDRAELAEWVLLR